jgi:hypothetical protein
VVEHDLGHARDLAWRVVRLHRSVAVARDELQGTLAVEEVERRDVRLQVLLPPLRCRVASDVADQVPVEPHAVGRVGRLRMAEVREKVAAALREPLRRPRKHPPAHEAGLVEAERDRDDSRDDGEQARPGRARREVSRPTRGRHELGRRRFPRRQRRLEGIAAGEEGEDRTGRRGPRRGILVQALEDHRLHLRLEEPRARGDAAALGLPVLRAQLGERLALEEPAAREHLVEDEPQGVEVALRRRRPAFELLRRHVDGRPRESGVGGGVERQREAEVGETRLAAAVHHDVGRLQVAMHDAAVVHGGEARAEVAREVERLVRREPPDAGEERAQVLAVHVLHREERVAPVLHDVVQPAHVRVRDLPPDPDLRVEPLQHLRRQRPADELEGHRLSELRVLRAVDLAHPAAPEEGHDAIAVGEHGAGRERARVGRARLSRPRAGAALRQAREVGRRRGRVAFLRAVRHRCQRISRLMVAARPRARDLATQPLVRSGSDPADRGERRDPGPGQRPGRNDLAFRSVRLA